MAWESFYRKLADLETRVVMRKLVKIMVLRKAMNEEEKKDSGASFFRVERIVCDP